MFCPRVLLIDLYIFDPMFDPVFSLWKPKIREAAYKELGRVLRAAYY